MVNDESPRYGSVFSGIGGLDLGVELAFGAECAWQCERDPLARGVLRRRWPGARLFGDVRDLARGARAGREFACDILAGGPPCQDVSVAGRGAGMGAGTRSGLWDEMRRIAARLRPPLVFVENPALSRRRWLPTVAGDLAALGYGWAYVCVRASALGFRHERDRVFVLAADFGGPRPDGRRRAEALLRRAVAFGVASDPDGDRRPERGVVPGAETPEEAGREAAPGRGWWHARSGMVRAFHGLPLGVDDGPPGQLGPGVPGRRGRIRALGNAVIPAQPWWAVPILARAILGGARS